MRIIEAGDLSLDPGQGALTGSTTASTPKKCPAAARGHHGPMHFRGDGRALSPPREVGYHAPGRVPVHRSTDQGPASMPLFSRVQGASCRSTDQLITARRGRGTG